MKKKHIINIEQPHQQHNTSDFNLKKIMHSKEAKEKATQTKWEDTNKKITYINKQMTTTAIWSQLQTGFIDFSLCINELEWARSRLIYHYYRLRLRHHHHLPWVYPLHSLTSSNIQCIFEWLYNHIIIINVCAMLCYAMLCYVLYFVCFYAIILCLFLYSFVYFDRLLIYLIVFFCLCVVVIIIALIPF